ncbi:MAG: phage portal protein [Candidatus Babeliales bacterium]|jgi:hypothetical protein
MPHRYIEESPQQVKQDAPFEVSDMRDNSIKVERQKLVAPSYLGWQGVPRKLYGGGDAYDYLESRRISLTPTPRLCIQRLKLDVGGTDWEIVPLCEEGSDKPTDEAIEHARQIFNWLYFRPNCNGEPFTQIMYQLVDDILTHDAGVLTKLYGSHGSKRLVEIQARDGALFTKDIDEYNRLGVKYPSVQMETSRRENMRVGYWYNWNTEPKIAYEPHEIVYISHDPRTDIRYGTSKMQVLKSLIYSLMYSEEYYYKFWEEGGNNPGIISPDITTASGSANILNPTEYKAFKEAFSDKLRDYMKMLIAPGKTQISPLSDPKALGWLETEDSYRHLVVALFNETPAILGWTKDIHKATDESQKSIYIQKGLWPLLNTIQWYMNTQVIADWFWSEDKERNVFAHGHEGKFAGKKMDCMFRYKLYDPIGEKLQLDIDEQRLKNGLTSINNLLREQHRGTVDWGDINPLFLYNVQQWGQSYAGGSMEVDVFKNLTGVEPMIKEIQQAIQPKPKDENANINSDIVKAFNKSRDNNPARTFDCSSIKAFELPATIRSSPRFGRGKYPQHKVVE